MTSNDQPYPWASLTGFMEARLFGENAEEVTYFFRRIGATARGVAKAISKEEFERHWRLKPQADDDGCPHGDPDCEGRNGDCHDACSTYAERGSAPGHCATCGFPWGSDPVRHAEFCSDRRPS